jgi:prevent-host-death family protein
MEVGITAAKKNLSRLVKAAMAGDEIVITKRGKPVVRLVPEAPQAKDNRRGFGSLKGILNLPPGWDSPEADKELLDTFECLKSE